KRFVKFIQDAAGHPILTKTGLPVVFDLKNRPRFWNWPELMDIRWLEAIRSAEKPLRDAAHPDRALASALELAERLAAARKHGDIPPAFRPAVHRLQQSLQELASAGTVEQPDRTSRVLQN